MSNYILAYSIKIPNLKHQITNKSQISITNDRNILRNCTGSLKKPCRLNHLFGILNLDHWNLFGI